MSEKDPVYYPPSFEHFDNAASNIGRTVVQFLREQPVRTKVDDPGEGEEAGDQL